MPLELEDVLVRGFERPTGEGLVPYLVRGVTMGTPTFSVLRRNTSTNELVVFRAIWNGEMSFPHASGGKFGIWPIVIYLKKLPMRVYPTLLSAE